MSIKNNYKVSKNFIIQEFVPPEIFVAFGERSIWFIDFKLVGFCQWLHDYINSTVVINNYAFGGKFKESGFRVPTSPTGAKLSQHKFGRGIDPKVDNYQPEEIRGIIRKNFDLLNINYGITTIEKDTETWTHVDTRYTGLKYLLEVNGK